MLLYPGQAEYCLDESRTTPPTGNVQDHATGAANAVRCRHRHWRKYSKSTCLHNAMNYPTHAWQHSQFSLDRKASANTFKIATRVASLGMPILISRSNLPARLKAASIASGRLVAPTFHPESCRRLTVTLHDHEDGQALHCLQAKLCQEAYALLPLAGTHR